MSLQEVIDVARNFAVMVRVQGPDPKGLKMRKHAFHLYNSGKTTLSASGMLLPGSFVSASVAKQIEGESVLVITVASVIEPFLSQQDRDNMEKLEKPALIPGAQVDILVEGKEFHAVASKEALHWLPAELLRVVNVPTSSTAVQSLIEASSGSIEHEWEIGWSLASYGSGHQSFMDSAQKQVEQASLPSQTNTLGAESGNPSLMGKSTTRVALLKVNSSQLMDLPRIGTSHLNRRGDLLLSIGSPFGILSPIHFFNSISVGSIANIYPSSKSKRSLLMADIRCLPGMEGSPVFGEHAELIGILSRPLRQRSSAAEIQMIIPWEAIASVCSDILQKQPEKTSSDTHYNGISSALGTEIAGGSPKDNHGYIRDGPSSSIEKATASICLITVDDGAWASGILLNKQGLVLTNAHLLEPWRFGKASANGEAPKDLGLLLTGPEYMELSVKRKQRGFRDNLKMLGLRRICVRLDFMDPWVWTDAKVVHVSKGPLDVALLQLEFVPDQLCPIAMDFTRPSPGSKAYILGHGLFGPRCDFLPSACLGVIAKVVEAKGPLLDQSSTEERYFPAMLETTAAVHPGGSGGAVVNSDGLMIGLVTSNARHGGGTVIPHLNFSIPCAALEPIFEFSKDMKDLSLLEYLDKPNKQLSSVWALAPPLSSKPSPSLLDLPLLPQDKDTKGSRFAKFISDRNDLLKNDQLEKSRNKFISSKL